MRPDRSAPGPRRRSAASSRYRILLLKTAIWVTGLAPVLWLAVGFFQRSLGVNPVEKIIHVQGRWTLVFLLATLAVTPIRRLTGWNRIVQVRRLLGLFAFAHACIHFLAYAGMDQLFALSYILEDALDRRYITAGFTSLVLMIPLAVTSTKGWIRRLGKRWQRLHRLAYVAAGLGVLHYFWKAKGDTFWPLVAALTLAALLAVRVAHRKRRPGGPRRNPGGLRKRRGAPLARRLGLLVFIAGMAALPALPGCDPRPAPALSGPASEVLPPARATRFAALEPVPSVAGAASALPSTSLPLPSAQLSPPPEWHEFYFTRAAYSSYGRGWGRRSNAWSTDYPKADIQFLTVLQRLTNLDAYGYENAVLLTDDSIRRYPFLYALEVGYMDLSPPEIEGLREYLTAGGFLVVDDFWGSREWTVFEWNMNRVFPARPIIDLDLDHPVFSTFYDIEEILQVPAYGRYRGGATWERDGYTPAVKGIVDDDGRLMVIINWNTDLGDAWEWAEQPDYPLQYSTFAFQMGVNMIIYAMSH